eukprot:CAMPEP_0197620516 /NCGR_PEP_ID=MMETSP1338-20131121/1332_1 /TAXON_ID=43686 ORGANISM="Pelagodinium beii, Strain RCC1491" /NCGR_SAMPLE_ID=MMETSP1338 /ASSEMBLY_ACC=CAM_ASM_000754 /LENGTH=34 /DNA_ID= /DNA_START= /DNA_END= /DNA_ORIENTATION=
MPLPSAYGGMFSGVIMNMLATTAEEPPYMLRREA